MSLSAKQHGLLALLILLALLAVFYLVLIQPAITQRDENQARIETLFFQFSQFSRADAELARLKGDIDRLRAQETGGGDFMAAAAPAIAAASLQRDLKAMIETSGGELVSSQAALPGRDEETYPRVTVKAQMQADMNALRAVLYQLMIHRPLLFTDNIMIQRRNISPGRPDSGGGLLEVHFDVSGYLGPVNTTPRAAP